MPKRPPSPKSREFTIIRVYDAPVSAVWDAWTDTDQVAQWWGPRGFTTTTHSKDLRPGGTWRYTMHGPDGTDYPSVTLYHEVERHAKLVYDHGGSDDLPPLFRVKALFAAQGNGTRMELTFAFETPEKAAETLAFIKTVGGFSTWDRLAEYLLKRSANREAFVIAREFDAPVERVFEMWTDPKHLAHWLPPGGAPMEFLSCDIREGGGSHYAMALPTGQKMYGRASYLEITPPTRIVYTQRFCDAEGRPARHPFAPTWPESMLTTVTLSSAGPDRTLVRIEWEPHGAFSPGELETFVSSRAGMTQGWTASLDNLEAALAPQE
jgi:uncharacterized protein YndB with AHSA1/START domain